MFFVTNNHYLLVGITEYLNFACPISNQNNEKVDFLIKDVNW